MRDPTVASLPSLYIALTHIQPTAETKILNMSSAVSCVQLRAS